MTAEGWWRFCRSATGSVLALLAVLLLPVGVVVVAGSGADLLLSGDGKGLLAFGALILVGALPLGLAAGALRRDR